MLCYPATVLFAITDPAVNDRGPRYMQAAFAALRQSLARGEVLQLNYATYEGHVGLFCRVPDARGQEVMQLIQAKYPNCTLTTLGDEELDPPRDLATYAADLTLSPSLFPVLRHEQFEDLLERRLEDPLELLMGVLSTNNPDNVSTQIQIQ